MPIRRTLAGVAMAVTVVVGGLAVPAEAANSNSALATCPTVSPRLPIHPVSTFMFMDGPIHVGPAAACKTVGTEWEGDPVDVYCVYHNRTTGNDWDYMYAGWIWDAYVEVTPTAVC